MRIKPSTNNPGSELNPASPNAQTPATPNTPVDTLLEPFAPEKTNQNNVLDGQNPLQEPTSASQTGLQKTDAILRRGWETHLLKSWSAMVEGGFDEIPDATHLAKQNPSIKLSFLPPLGTARLDYMTAQKRLGQETLWASNQGTLQLKETLGRDVKLEDGDSIFSGWSLSNPMRYNLELPLGHDLEDNPNPDVARQSLEAFVLQDLSTQTILNLPPGARLELEGEGFYLGQRKRFSNGAPGEVGEHKIYLEVTRLNDDKVSVKLSHKRNRPRLLKALENASSSLSASAKLEDGGSISAELELGFEWHETFEIDLEHPNAQNHIQTLLALDARSADQESQTADSGLIRTSKLKPANNNLNINFTPLSITEAISDEALFGLTLRTSHEWLNAEDSIIRTDPLRNAYTKSAAQEGEPISWFRTTGVIEPRLSLLAGFSETGAASMEAGVQLGGVLRYSVLSAHPKDMNGTTLKAFDDAIEMAAMDLNALSAPEIPPGTEITYQGIGTIRGLLRASAGYNRELGPGFELAASLSSELSAEEMGEIALNVKKLADGRLTLTILRASQDTQSAGIRLKAGIDFDAVEALENYSGDSVITGWLDGKFDEALHGLMEDTVRDLTNIKASAKASLNEGHREILKIGPLDAGDIENKELIKSLLLPQISSEAFSASAAFLQLNESHQVDRKKTELEFMSKRIFLHEVLKQQKEGHLASDLGAMVYTEQEIKHNHTFLAELHSEWEAVTYKTDLLAEGEATFFHLKLNFDDPFTSAREVKDFQELVKSFDAKLIADPKTDTTGFFGRIFSKHGQTTKNIDVWFSDDGIEELIECTPDKVRQVFIQNAAEQDPDFGTPPWLGQADAEDWTALFANYERLSRHQSSNRDRLSDLKRDYRRKFKRNIRDDALLFSQMTLFESTIAKISSQSLTAEDMPQLLDELVTLGEVTLLGEDQRRGKKEFFLRSLGTLADLMSPEHIYINQMSLVGKNVNIRTESEGRLIHPSEVIAKNLDRDQ